MNYKGILFFLGIYSLFISFFSFLNILYSYYFHSISNLNSYIICLIASIFFGLCFCLFGRKNNKNISLSDQIILILLTINVGSISKRFICILFNCVAMLNNMDKKHSNINVVQDAQ